MARAPDQLRIQFKVGTRVWCVEQGVEGIIKRRLDDEITGLSLYLVELLDGGELRVVRALLDRVKPAVE